MKYDPKFNTELEELLKIASKDKELLHEFLHDLLSPAEFRELALRWQIVKLLKQKVPHREIARKLHTSIGTVTRGSREMQNPHGGFQKMLKKLKL
jgi:Trp operon repressor